MISRLVLFRFSFDLTSRLLKMQSPANKQIVDRILLAHAEQTGLKALANEMH